MKVYIITEQFNEEFHILRVFTDKAQASKFVDSFDTGHPCPSCIEMHEKTLELSPAQIELMKLSYSQDKRKLEEARSFNKLLNNMS